MADDLARAYIHSRKEPTDYNNTASSETLQELEMCDRQDEDYPLSECLEIEHLQTPIH